MNGDVVSGFNAFRAKLFGNLRRQLALIEFNRNNPDLREIGQVLLQKRGCRR